MEQEYSNYCLPNNNIVSLHGGFCNDFEDTFEQNVVNYLAFLNFFAECFVQLERSIFPCNYFARDGYTKHCDQCVCMFVSQLAFLKTTRPNFTKFSVHVACGRGSVLL